MLKNALFLAHQSLLQYRDENYPFAKLQYKIENYSFKDEPILEYLKNKQELLEPELVLHNLKALIAFLNDILQFPQAEQAHDFKQVKNRNGYNEDDYTYSRILASVHGLQLAHIIL